MHERWLRGIVVSHSHWDRAWYLPFEAFRLRLVRMVDSLLDLLEGDDDYAAFTLDGQTVLLEDYLALRPEGRSRVADLVRAGRLAIGPWYSLPDLFLPCAEAVVRNLQRGRRMAREFGEPLSVGYVPDPFGHFAQLPQILRRFGMDSFLFMRGAGDFVDRTGAVFDWRAPDGSTVLAVYLRDGYLSLGALGHPTPFGRFDGRAPGLDEARRRVDAAVALLAPLQGEHTLLLPNGCDHMPPQPELPGLLRELNGQGGAVELVHGTFEDFVQAIRAEGLSHAVYEGDLLGNRHHPILLGVHSTRMYLKQANRRAEHLLIRVAEPLLAWLGLLRPLPDPAPFLDRAWRLLLRAQAHDDICGCSVDEVHDDDEVRLAQVRTIAETLVVEALEAMAPTEGASALVACNPHPFPVRTRLRATVLLANPGGEFAEPTPERAIEVRTSRGAVVPSTVTATEAMVVRSAFLETTWGRRYDVTIDVELPPLGYELLTVDETATPPRRRPRSTPSGDELRFEYELDGGDTYSFGPVAGDGPRTARPLGRPRPRLDGTLRRRWRLSVPAGLVDGRPSRRTLALDLDVELLPGFDGAVHCTVRYENRACDGRLRVLVPVGFVASELLVDGQFRLAPRSVPAPSAPPTEPYPGEGTYDTFPQGAFALAEAGERRMWLANEGNPEVSLVQRDGAAYVALTLHRAVGMLSRTGGALRRCGAGPAVPTPGAQCRRPMEHRFAYGGGVMSRADAVRRALIHAEPPVVFEMPCLPHARPTNALPRSASFLAVDSPDVRLSSCRPHPDGGVALRLFETSGHARRAVLTLGLPVRRYCMSSLDETWDEASARDVDIDRIELTFGPHEIVTVLLR